MSVKMMPPKKSKAARSDNLDANTDEKPAESAPPERPLPAADSDDEPMTGVPPKKKPFNMFDITTVEGKRKRNVYTPEAALNEWIDEYFEEKADVKLNLGEVYNIYLAKCVDEASNALEDSIFNKVMRQKFPNGFSLKPNSPYGDRLKEKKVKKKEPKVKADTLSIKIRDIIENSLKELGNPRGGVRFGKLITHIAGKYPALRIEMRPKMLLAALQRGVRYGYLTLDRGIGKCGYYRLYVADEPDEEEETDDKKKDDKKKDDKKKDDKKKDGDDEKNGDEKDEEKSADDSADESKDKDIKTEDGKEDSKDKENEKGATKRKAKKKVPRERFIHHGDPARVEDTFYLAMTFMSEPKEASVIRIKKYIAEHYTDANVDRVARCLDTGKERGYWEQTSGTSGAGGKFRLEVDSFDPTDDEDMTGMVINAIMACTEPKMCSANLLKKYVMEWYADKFKVAERPHLFKKAIDRAVANQEIKQLSGIGASGTFQLAKPFFPSPAILAGQDTPSDYEQDSEDTSDEEAVESYDFSGYGDKYKPRPSKRRGMARSKAVHAKPAVEVHEEPQKRKRKASRKAAQKARKRSRQDSSSEEESSDESSDESDSESEEEAPPPKKRGAPKKREAPAAKKRGASPAKKAPAKKAAAKKAPAKKAAPEPKGRGRARVNYADSSSGDDSDDEKVVDGYKPTPSRSRGGASARTPVAPPSKKKTPKKNTPAKKQPKKEPKPEPEPETPSRRVRTVAAKKQGDDIRYNEDSDSPDSIDSEPRARRVETPAAKKQRSATAPKSRGRRK